MDQVIPPPRKERTDPMPLKIVLDTTRPNGEPALYCPQVFCDRCGLRIERSGNVEWAVAEDGSTDGAVSFTHKECCRPFEKASGGRLRWYWMELRHLPRMLA